SLSNTSQLTEYSSIHVIFRQATYAPLRHCDFDILITGNLSIFSTRCVFSKQPIRETRYMPFSPCRRFEIGSTLFSSTTIRQLKRCFEDSWTYFSRTKPLTHYHIYAPIPIFLHLLHPGFHN